MGKYMKKGKTGGEVALMEVAQTSLGVRTRAKTLALQQLEKSAAEAVAAAASAGDGSYLQLRSRRLEKPSIAMTGESKKQRRTPKGTCSAKPHRSPNSRTSSKLKSGSANSGPAGSVSPDRSNKEEIHSKTEKVGGTEDSFGENVSEERSIRESTPCSLIRDPESIRTPGSTTKHTYSTEPNSRVQHSIQRIVPTTHEVDEYLDAAAEKLRNEFIEKYNFDPVEEKPLPGRYEWVKVDP